MGAVDNLCFNNDFFFHVAEPILTLLSFSSFPYFSTMGSAYKSIIRIKKFLLKLTIPKICLTPDTFLAVISH